MLKKLYAFTIGAAIRGFRKLFQAPGTLVAQFLRDLKRLPVFVWVLFGVLFRKIRRLLPV